MSLQSRIMGVAAGVSTFLGSTQIAEAQQPVDQQGQRITQQGGNFAPEIPYELNTSNPRQFFAENYVGGQFNGRYLIEELLGKKGSDIEQIQRAQQALERISLSPTVMMNNDGVVFIQPSSSQLSTNSERGNGKNETVVSRNVKVSYIAYDELPRMQEVANALTQNLADWRVVIETAKLDSDSKFTQGFVGLGVGISGPSGLPRITGQGYSLPTQGGGENGEARGTAKFYNPERATPAEFLANQERALNVLNRQMRIRQNQQQNVQQQPTQEAAPALPPAQVTVPPHLHNMDINQLQTHQQKLEAMTAIGDRLAALDQEIIANFANSPNFKHKVNEYKTLTGSDKMPRQVIYNFANAAVKAEPDQAWSITFVNTQRPEAVKLLENMKPLKEYFDAIKLKQQSR